jgi:phage shock protein PspC (stress-responsive transcriptional regulator)
MKNKFYRSYSDRKLSGVCSGLGRYTNTDPLLWRIGFIVLGPGMLLYYIIITLLTETIEYHE